MPWVVLAACLTVAEPPPIQRPSAPPSGPEAESDAAPEPEPSTPPTDELVTPPELPPIGDEAPPEPIAEGPPPAVEDSPYPDTLLPAEDELLPPGTPARLRTEAELKVRALEGEVGILVLLDGSERRGLIKRAGVDHLAVVDHESGEMDIIALRSVADARFLGSEDLPRRSGIGLIVGGSILASIGTPVFISGITFSIVLSEEPAVYAPMLLVGGAALGGGIAMVVQGVRRRRRYNAAAQGHAAYVTPGGLALRF